MWRRIAAMHRFRLRLNTLLSIVLIASALPAYAQEPSWERLINSDREPQNWMSYGGNYAAHRFSALDQINRDNVKQLTPVWMFHTGELRGGLNSTPIVVDGVMYLMGPMNRVFAINAATGEKLWSYIYKLPQMSIPYQPGSRGLAVAYGRVYFGTLDNHVVALDAKTGREIWDVEVEDVRQCGCNITSAPLVVKDKVIVGGTGGEHAHRGYLNAYDAKTGKHVWRFYTIPGPGEPGFETWSEKMWKYGGAPTWLVGSYDPELNLLYWGVGNPSSDFYDEFRPGDNLYSNSIIALDPDTGKLKWYYQEVPHDMYDFDSAYECADRLREGRPQTEAARPREQRRDDVGARPRDGQIRQRLAARRHPDIGSKALIRTGARSACSPFLPTKRLSSVRARRADAITIIRRTTRESAGGTTSAGRYATSSGRRSLRSKKDSPLRRRHGDDAAQRQARIRAH